MEAVTKNDSLLPKTCLGQSLAAGGTLTSWQTKAYLGESGYPQSFKEPRIVKDYSWRKLRCQDVRWVGHNQHMGFLGDHQVLRKEVLLES